MCGILGVYGSVDPDKVAELLIQSQIRGKHATGVSYMKNGKLHTIIEPLPAEKFVEKHNISDMMDGEVFKLIGHCRYSTSDINYNQPIHNDEESMVHNGVITQEPPEKWKQLYGYDAKTTNDSELLFLSGLAMQDVLHVWQESSIAAIHIVRPDYIAYYRNGKRPLYHVRDNKRIIVVSTPDIYKRTFGKDETSLIPPFKYHVCHGTNPIQVSVQDSKYQGTDLQ